MKNDPAECSLCIEKNLDTASELAWVCPINEKVICETHCAEIQLVDYEATRLEFNEFLSLTTHPDHLLAFCKKCKHGGKV